MTENVRRSSWRIAFRPGHGRSWQIAMGVLGVLALFAICATIAGLLMERHLKAYALLTAVGYTLSALGFLSLAWWAFARGHFHDVEAVKHKVLEAEGVGAARSAARGME